MPHSVTLNIDNYTRDPSRTTVLRGMFKKQMQRRFRELTGVIKQSVVSEDVFGLMDNSRTNTINVLQSMRTPGRRSFNFSSNPRKIAAFLKWLRAQVQAGIIDVRHIDQVGNSIHGSWQNMYIYAAYKKGVVRARQEMRRQGLRIPTIEESGGIEAWLNIPIHADRVGILYLRAFNELTGITAGMDQVISRVLSIGLVEGHGPRVIADMLVHAINGIGNTLSMPISYVDPRTGQLVNYVMPAERRALILARTEIIRAHAQGQLQEYQNWRVEGVHVKAEFLTAGDGRVCLQCSSMEGNIYTIEEARNIIPVHPQCRCIWLPILDI